MFINKSGYVQQPTNTTTRGDEEPQNINIAKTNLEKVYLHQDVRKLYWIIKSNLD